MSDDADLKDPFPAIEISSLFGDDRLAQAATITRIMVAARDSGFLVVTGLPDDCLSAVLRKRMLTIFSLSDAEKRRLCRQAVEPTHKNIYRGWFPLQQGQASYKEGLDMGPDVAHGATRVDAGDPLTEATPLPDEDRLPGWRAAVATYYRGMEKTGAALMRAIARGLGLPAESFAPAFEGGLSSLRLARYPVRTFESFGADAESFRIVQGGQDWTLINVPHVDSGFVTLVAQDGIQGLQAELEPGAWVTVPPQEGTVAVNFGMLLERWTGGAIKATRHRVIGRSEERYSVPFFYEPRVDARIAPIPGVTPEDFAPFLYGDHLWAATTQFVEQAGIAHLRQPRGLSDSG
ncbi:MAG: oxidoreductase [Rhodospirillales bacterium]